MDIPIDAEVFCSDGLCGRSTCVILEPGTEEVTHLVVKEKDSPRKEILIPVTAVTETTPDSINLRYNRDQVAEQQPFVETDFVQVDIPRLGGGVYFTEPYAHPKAELRRVEREAVPPGELALCPGAWVEATDGRVGRVDEFLMNPQNDHITHLVLREGHLWGQRDVTIPVSEIERIEDNTVYLKIDTHEVESLPTVPLNRKGQ
jgi:sporulation protein YlmC with PRC-barrel domain